MVSLKEDNIWTLLRLGLGWIFLWAFLDKAFGLGFSTSSENAWIAGGSPTTGFLSNAPTGPFAFLFTSMAGNVLVDWLFMLGMGFAGIFLILGITRKLASVVGILLMVSIYLSRIPPTSNPFMDQHIIYIIILLGLIITKSGRGLSLGNWWNNLGFVKRFSILQ